MAKRLLLLLAVLAVVGVCAGPWFYRTQMEGAPAPALTLPSTLRPATTNLDGKWIVAAGPDDEANRSQAGYRARQHLLWETVTVTGRTNSVRGDATVAGGTLQAASFVVDVATMQSPHRGRDDRFRGTDVMDAAKFPTAKLAVLDPVNLSSISGDGAPTTMEVSAQLTLKGVARQVAVRLDVQRSGNGVVAVGQIPVTFADYGIVPPAPPVGLLAVDPIVTIEFLVNLVKR
ncbi:YceI family protein [Mycolicibacterium mucogenicum]|uniref:YceI family protein n=1 Tax=Mycolicibacterium TaxID=1866885 RepID=UPI00226AC6BF|nr:MULTISPECIES: YceI family protein [Mycolicibacterium]MCX8560720.1 YceI family protein [Mycolicibacterium mucogenicum]